MLICHKYGSMFWYLITMFDYMFMIIMIITYDNNNL